MLDELINISKSYIGKTPNDFDDCDNWTDLEEKLEIEMRECVRDCDQEEFVNKLTGPHFNEINKESIKSLKNNS